MVGILTRFLYRSRIWTWEEAEDQFLILRDDPESGEIDDIWSLYRACLLRADPDRVLALQRAIEAEKARIACII